MINAIAPALGEWVAMWRRSLPGFRVDSLYRAAERAFEAGYVQPLKNVYPPDAENAAVFAVLAADSPDGRYRLVFDWYQRIAEYPTGIEIGGEPDSAPLLLDFRLGISSQFETCGTPCGFDWGTWLSPARFALAGWQEADATGRWAQGHLTLYSIADSTAVTYVTRPIAAADFARYRAAWRDWVVARYRASRGAGGRRT